MTSFHERLKVALAKMDDQSNKSLARACGVSDPSVSAWLSGDTKLIAGSHLLKAAKYLNVSPWWLVFGEGSMRPVMSLDTALNSVDAILTTLSNGDLDKARLALSLWAGGAINAQEVCNRVAPNRPLKTA